MRKNSLKGCLVLAVLGVLAGCSGDDGASPVVASELCEKYVEAFCEGLAACCSGEDGFGTVSEVTCRSAELSYCEQALLSVDDRGAAPIGPNVPARIVFEFDERSAGEAIDRVHSVFSRCEGEPYVAFGDTHYLGQPGASCLQNADCIEGARCEHPARAVFGTCVLAPLEGQACTDVCASSELRCTADDNGESICVELRGEGEACWEVPCHEGLACVDVPSLIVGGSSGGECVPQRRDGQSCSVDAECSSYVCLSGRCAPDQFSSAHFCSYFPDVYFSFGGSGSIDFGQSR